MLLKYFKCLLFAYMYLFSYLNEYYKVFLTSLSADEFKTTLTNFYF